MLRAQVWQSEGLAPNPTSRRDHSDLLQFHFFNQNEIRIELIAERAACRIDGHSSSSHDAAEPPVEADRFQLIGLLADSRAALRRWRKRLNA